MIRRRSLLAGAAAIALAPRLRAAARRRFGGALDAGLLEKSPAGIGAANPRTLDPHLARTRLERELARALQLPLFAKGARGQTLLVESAVRDAHVWTITLRPGLFFADGSPVTTADAAAALTRALASPAGRVLSTLVGEVRAKDDRRLLIETRVPVLDLAPILGGVESAIVSLKTIDPFFGPIGLGGFRPDRQKGNEIAFAANLHSPAGRAWLDRLRIVAGDTPDASAAYRRGTLAITVAGRGADREHDRVSNETASTIFLLLSPRLSADLRTRAAAAPNVKVLTDVFLQGRARAATSLLPPALTGPLGATLPPRERSPKSAAKTKLSLFVSDASAEIQTVAERLVFDLLENGIAATTGWKTPEALEEAVLQDRFDLALAEWVPLDADGGRAIAGAAKDPRLANSLAGAAEIAAIEDFDLRTQAAVAAAARATGSGLLVPLVHPRRALRASAQVEGLAISASGAVDWCEVGLR